MKMGDPGYFEREARHDATTARMRDNVKDAVAFYLAVEVLRKDGVDIPRGLRYSADFMEFDKTLEKIGPIITQAKGLTIDDASPDLRKALLKETKEVIDMRIGAEYFSRIQEEQKKRVLDKDVAHISYYSHYGKKVDIAEIIKKVKSRESQPVMTKGRGITD